jgi:RHS repeat-associated protein
VEAQTSRVKSVTDGNGNVTSYTYDTLDHVKTITYNSNGTITYNYDADGNLLSLVDNTGTTSFKYDNLNRLTKKTLPDGTVFSTGYDPTGNLTTFTDGSESIVYKYDIANRMVKLLDNGLLTVYGYDNANRKTLIQYPNGTGMVIAYDKAGHETSNVGGTMNSNGTILTTYDSFSYNYFKGSAPTALLQTETLLDPVKWQSGTMYTRNYTYDSQNRVTDVDVLNSNNVEVQKWTYGYDANGNRTSYTQLSPAVSIGYTYTGGNEIQTETQGSTTLTFSFDGNGNLTGQTSGQSLAYNGKEQTTGIGSNSYTYSGPSQQDRVQINGATLDYSGLGVSQQTDSSGTTYFTRCSCGLLNNERIPNGSRYYYLFDGLGSIVGMTSDSGSKVNSYDYDAYGVMLNQVEKTGVNNPFKYAGGYLDASGYYQFGVRYYDPSLGRWTQQDSVAGSLFDLNSANRYTYVEDDPVNLVDPSGKASVPNFSLACFFGAVGGIATVIVGALVAEALSLGIDTPITVAVLVSAALTGCLVAVILAFVQAVYNQLSGN